ncbi:hypothetical protein ZIOFF_043647 [Zingiber officinale]|uniref:Uncharacterized protein n=1 Tax=Zingiber officinale TaxID=94328 RepID=A0A8J5KU36_ZINOF|nr:hypothetical protein ZIOFF_043647 [Zingiber officinale]
MNRLFNFSAFYQTVSSTRSPRSYDAAFLFAVLPYSASATAVGVASTTGKHMFMAQYLVESCDFDQEKATEASKLLKGIQSRQQPDSILASLKSYGFNDASVKRLIRYSPKCLLLDVEKTLPKVPSFRRFSLLKSKDVLVKLFKRNLGFLSYSVEKKIEHNLELLRELSKMRLYFTFSPKVTPCFYCLCPKKPCGVGDSQQPSTHQRRWLPATISAISNVILHHLRPLRHLRRGPLTTESPQLRPLPSSTPAAPVFPPFVDSNKFVSPSWFSTVVAAPPSYDNHRENPEAFMKFLEEAEKPLYKGCKRYTKLSVLVKLYNTKARHGMSDALFSDLLANFGGMLPDNHNMPSSIYEAKKTLSCLALTKYDEPRVVEDTELHQDADGLAAAELRAETEIEEPSITGQKKTRGPTSMCRLIAAARWGKKSTIEYDDMGRPVNNENGKALQSFIGSVVRSMVPINIKSWPTVPENMKQKVWEEISNVFDLAPQSEAAVMSSAGQKWRDFKNKLNSRFVSPYRDNPEKLRSPPEQYQIPSAIWKAFVDERLHPSWESLHFWPAELLTAASL